jgi:hypothetical protein
MLEQRVSRTLGERRKMRASRNIALQALILKIRRLFSDPGQK